MVPTPTAGFRLPETALKFSIGYLHVAPGLEFVWRESAGFLRSRFELGVTQAVLSRLVLEAEEEGSDF